MSGEDYHGLPERVFQDRPDNHTKYKRCRVKFSDLEKISRYAKNHKNPKVKKTVSNRKCTQKAKKPSIVRAFYFIGYQQTLKKQLTTIIYLTDLTLDPQLISLAAPGKDKLRDTWIVLNLLTQPANMYIQRARITQIFSIPDNVIC